MRTLSKPIGTIFVLISIFLFSQPAQAKYGGGSGTADDPYQIATAKNLNDLGESPEDYNKHFILTDNIDLDPNLPGLKVFDKAVIASFTGVFDGNGHTISHLTIKGGGYLGLFGDLRTRAEVRDLGIADVNITASDDYVGGLVGINGGALTGCHSTGVISGLTDVGGLAGDNWGTVAQCYSACAVSGDNGVGGLMGANSNGTVSNCYSNGPVRGTGRNGGLMAYNLGVVIHCFWDIQTSGQTTSAGGTGKTTAEMQTASTFLEAGWDFVGETANGTEDIWRILQGKDYPRLWWEQPAKYGGGTGESNDPYLIYTAEHLNPIGAKPNDWNKHFKLMADIDLAGFDGEDGRPAFNVIAPDSDPARVLFQGVLFTGIFDGNGHTISHLTVKGGGYLGLFGGSGGEVKDLGLVNVNIIASDDCAGGLLAVNWGALTGCHSTGVVSGANGVGGLVGANAGHLAQCYSACAVSGNEQVGGLMGNSSNSTVTRCYSTGTVSGQDNVGGLVGYNGGHVANCYSTSVVGGTGVFVGGLVGGNTGSANVSDCYSTGAISGTTGHVGGLVGYNFGNVIVTDCFWDTQTSGQVTSAGGTGKTTVEMQTASTFLEARWDFVNIWGIVENQTYPYLRKYSAADINQDASVNFLDLAALAENWLTGLAP